MTELYSVKQVAEKLSVNKTTVWNWCNPKHKRYKPDFPKPIKLGERATRWKGDEIQQYINAL